MNINNLQLIFSFLEQYRSEFDAYCEEDEINSEDIMEELEKETEDV